MADKKIEVVITASDQASSKLKDFNGALTTSGKAADSAGSAYDRMSSLANRLQLNTLKLADAQRRLSTETDPQKQAQLRVEIDNLAKSQDTLQREIHESADAMQDMSGESSKGFKVLGLSLTDLLSGINLVAGGAQQLARVAKAAFDFTEEGASVVQTRQSFERLGVSMEDMRKSSLGTIDDMTLMKATLTLTAGASEELQAQLLQNAPKLLEIAKAANAVNPTLGTTAQMYESIATGIKRGSPLILDNLGIVVKVEEANQIYAATLGKTVEQMTAAEKQMALLNATVLAGDRLIEQAGGTVASFGDAWAQLRVELKNVSDDAKAQAAEALGPLLSRYVEFLQVTKENDQSLLGFAATIRLVSLSLTQNERFAASLGVAWKLFTLQLGSAYKEIVNLPPSLHDLAVKEEQTGDAALASANKLKRLNDERDREMRSLGAMVGPLTNQRTLYSKLIPVAEEVISAEFELTRAKWNDIEASKDAAKAWQQYSDAISDTVPAINNAERALANQNMATRIAAEVRSDLTDRLEDGASSLADLRQQQADVTAELDKLTASHGRAIVTHKEATLTEAEATLATLKLAAAQAELAKETDPLKAASLAVQIENLEGKLGEAATTTTTFVNNTKKIDELKGKYSDLAGEVGDVRDAIQETINGFIIQQLQARLAIDGWTEAETELFLGVAVGFGMMDENHAKLVRAIEEEALLVDEVGETSVEAMDNAAGAADRLIGRAKNVTWEYTKIGTTGVGYLSNLEEPTQREALLMRELGLATEESYVPLEEMGEDGPIFLQKVEAAAGNAALQLLQIGENAKEAQNQINKMEGKSITLTVNIDEVVHRQVGTTTNYKEEGLYEASGGDYIVNRPTTFIAGEAGTERAIFIPQGRKGFDGAVASQAMSAGGAGTSIGELNIYVNGTADAQETARLVMQEFQGRGLMPQIPLR